MSDESGSGEIRRQTPFKARLDETMASVRATDNAVQDAESKIFFSVEASRSDIERYQASLRRFGGLLSDASWVDALRKSGMTGDRIVELWNIKDESARTLRESMEEVEPEQ